MWRNRWDWGAYSPRPRSHPKVAGWEAGCLHLAFRLCRNGSRRWAASRNAHFANQVDQSCGRFRPLVGRARFRTRQGLFEIMSGEYRVAYGTTCLESGPGQTGGRFADDDVVVIGLSFDHGSERDYPVASLVEQRRGSDCQLPGACHPENVDFPNSDVLEIGEGAVEKTFGDDEVEV